MQRARLPYPLIPIAALVAITPLIARGCSCGHDFDFHLLSWLEAARQFTHGNLHPHWAYSPAYNAGEPRFVFYPPISWTIGAILGLLFPWTWTPILYTWLALTAAGFGLYYLAQDFTTPTTATLAAIIYITNPYTLFTAYERTAYAELLAAAVIPLLLHAILRDRVTIPRIAIPIALLWLTNAPAAVMSCYALALLTLIRLAATPTDANSASSSATMGGPSFAVSSQRVGYSHHARTTSPNSPAGTNLPSQTRLQIALNTLAGTGLGLGLAAVYILPAAYERRYVQIAMAIIPDMRIQDNFLFHHTGDIAHDQVLHTASLIAILLIVATITTLATLFSRNAFTSVTNPGAPSSARSLRLRWASRNSATAPAHLTHRQLLYSLAILALTITLLLTPITKILWTHTPELLFLQFPWRLLAILAAVLALAIALALTSLKLKPLHTTILTVAIAAALTYPAYKILHQPCDEEDTIQSRVALFQSNQGAEPTDEYTPTTADNDSLAQNNPPWWLSPDPNAKALTTAHLGPAPTHLTLTTASPETLILNLRNYPAWRITLNGTPTTTRLDRDDGLIALPIPAGSSTIDITYTHTLDQTIGDILTAISLIILITILASHRKSIA